MGGVMPNSTVSWLKCHPGGGGEWLPMVDFNP
jgi:hypothetical protein